MKRLGRVNLILILAVAGMAVILALMLFTKPSPTQVANDFMVALAKGDVPKLTELSFLDGDDKAAMTKKWEYTTQVVGPHYHFRWLTVAETQADSNTANVKIRLYRNSRNPGTYEENFAVPLIQKDGRWLVDVRSISRELYPGLPR